MNIMDPIFDVLIESDSEDDVIEDDLPIILRAIAGIRRAAVPKVYGFVEEIIPNYNNVDFRADFRYTSYTG